ncbi:histidine phosphatase family protein [Aliibacillus thermotolerans]|uniref:Histidine phosphatase family protein n=1 Tax=Aliibacillus thermotolerans TaxID=1834418 RepID=A0ABW0UAE9_9BACI|nr:histidine phosphatase family protein [Aliibacillus thermotolerans]MDA3128665.1 hypothetical protein [Aliibacillus thermotolerans]
MVRERTVYFLRHGMTEANVKRQYVGWLDPPILCSEIERLKQGNGMEHIKAVFSSDLERAYTTATVMFPKASVTTCWQLRELSFGDFEGKTYDDLKDDSEYQTWLDHRQATAPPGGESLSVFHERIRFIWKKMMEETKETSVAIVTHSGWIREWCRLFGNHLIAEEKLWKLPFGGGICGKFVRKKGEWQCMSLREVHITEKKCG